MFRSEDPKFTILRIGATITGALALLLILIAIVRPDMMSMAMVHTLMATVGL